MIYLAIALFIFPILVRSLWTENIFNIIKTTSYWYLSWYILSTVLITFSIPYRTYIIIFLIFPFSIFLYEIYNLLFVNRKNIKVNYLFISTIFLILLTLTINIFTYKSFGDSLAYLNFGSNYKNENILTWDLKYKFNSFYYVATIFGIYQSQFFYSIFLSAFLSIFLYLFVYWFIKKQVKSGGKTLSIIMIILISILSNTSFVSATNIVLCAFLLFFSIVFILTYKQENLGNFFLPFFAFQLMFLNISFNTWVIFLPIVSIFFIWFIFTQTKIQYYSIFPIMVYLIINSTIPDYFDTYVYLKITLFILFIVGAFYLFQKNGEIKVISKFSLKTHKFAILTQTIMKNKKKLIILIIAILAFSILVGALFVFRGDRNVEGGPTKNNIIPPTDPFWSWIIPIFSEEKTTKLYQLFYFGSFLLFIFIFFTYSIWTENISYLLLLVFEIFCLSIYLSLSIVQKEAPSSTHVNNFVASYFWERFLYAFVDSNILLVFIPSMNAFLRGASKIKQRALGLGYSFFSLAFFSSIFTPIALLTSSIIFTDKFSLNNSLITEGENELLDKNYNKISNLITYSEISSFTSQDTFPVSLSVETGLSYFRRIMNNPNDLRNNISIFNWSYWNGLNWHSDVYKKEYINVINHLVTNTNYFDVLILKNDSIFLSNGVLKSDPKQERYNVLDKNSEIEILESTMRHVEK